MSKLTDLQKARKISEASQKLAEYGWFMPAGYRLEAPPTGPIIYLCDLEHGALFLEAAVDDGIARVAQHAAQIGVSYEDGVDALTATLEKVSKHPTRMDQDTRYKLAFLAVLYVSGTQSLLTATKLGFPNPQFIVIKHRDAAHQGDFILRPFPVNHDGPMTPEMVAHLVNQVLAIDRVNHPERFPRATVIEFHPRVTPPE